MRGWATGLEEKKRGLTRLRPHWVQGRVSHFRLETGVIIGRSAILRDSLIASTLAKVFIGDNMYQIEESHHMGIASPWVRRHKRIESYIEIFAST